VRNTKIVRILQLLNSSILLINARSTADALFQQPEPPVILANWRNGCTNSRKSLDPVKSATTFPEPVAPSGTWDSKAKKHGVI
jgi:hypothetical protein